MKEFFTVVATDANPQEKSLLAEQFSLQNVQLILCERDGKKVLEALEANHPDACLLETFMPGMDAVSIKEMYEKFAKLGR